ncbi:hypothetical protein Golomagni_05305 [Golovinomyces magnicellulatus]|nr:hypothetical protein Golomagni_05305 [Golovinomyces magnicellulatus]
MHIAALFKANYAAARSDYWKGFNVQATKANGACKNQNDWLYDLNKLNSLQGEEFNSIRVFASSDCDTLVHAIPAALATGKRILVGIWTQDESHFEAEKQALLKAVRQYGFDWMVAVSVGSEDLYRKETSARRLSEQIYDVRGMLSTVYGYSERIEVGHVDTWNSWIDGSNIDVIKACDFIGVDIYPYFQYSDPNSIENNFRLFWEGIEKVHNTVLLAGGKKSRASVWVTETGWPTTGPKINQAVPSVTNAQTYWRNVTCSSFKLKHTFAYSLQDYAATTSFGVLDTNGIPQYDLSC